MVVLQHTTLRHRETVAFVFLVDEAGNAQEIFYNLQYLKNIFPMAKIICSKDSGKDVPSGRCKILYRGSGKSVSCYFYDIGMWFQNGGQMCQMYLDQDAWQNKPTAVTISINQDEL